MEITVIPEFLFDGSDWDNADETAGGRYAVIWCEFGTRRHRANHKVAAVDGRGYFDGEIYCCVRHKHMAAVEMHRRNGMIRGSHATQDP